MVEGYIKLPRILKDMLDNLLDRASLMQYSQLCFYNLTDLQNMYIKSDKKQITISGDPRLFSTTVLPAIVLA
ncbi:hypothetical protein RO3G_09813 [Rhizopus delemar RA 99-880]|uniref:Uncharacterized protein n=1 Tax=Rhizopus delemar (strain RA 99-880 / ATCC MYA-4621 / FGSC 9543 / NRRL 43880) TaxID=246409 RepID=I1C9H3_RHIO9|nr:hypothetical protein RO3G_09813 [Rhizopus delemar RA 99-880]|eukprot:EIE85103.1 hypothetical protein RO3G_09813 [Rhizopus delemar RA 99-880]